MTWQSLLDERLAERHRTSKEELDALRAVVERNLRDAKVEGLSADGRFGCAYEAALTLATMAIAAAGYRVKGPGYHRTTFQALPLAMQDTVADSRYFDRCRRLRNELSYEHAGVVTQRDVDELLQRVATFKARVEATLRARGPGGEA